MRYFVRWVQEALEELAAAWMKATSKVRQQLVVQSNRVDQRLSENPLGVGESRPGGKRIAFFLPLVVIFRVEQDEQTVTILHAHSVRPSRS